MTENIERYTSLLDMEQLPRHVAIIMDGNGRWARQRMRERTEGHSEGVNSVNRITRLASDLGIKYLTLYAFSTENWNRPTEEVEALMHLIGWTIRKETPDLKANNVKIHLLGDIARLPEEVRADLQHGVDETADCTGLNLCLCLSYSSRWEITQAVRELADAAVRGEIASAHITEKDVEARLSTSGIPDPDLLIRTGGEQRISNFLLWQAAYSELWFTPVLWPDFDEDEFVKALAAFQKRERRFGKTGEQVRAQASEQPAQASEQADGPKAVPNDKMKLFRFQSLFPILLLLLLSPFSARALDIKLASEEVPGDTIYQPDVIYSPIPKTYEIAGISVTGLPNSNDDYLVIGFSGLSIGERVEIPGPAITDAVKRFWRQGLYSKVEINVEKTVGDKVWLEIALKQQPRMSEMRFSGVKGGEKKDIEAALGMVTGQQLTPNIISLAKKVVTDFYEKKGFKNAEVTVTQQPDLSKENMVILNFDVNRNNKVKVHKIYVEGNEVLSDTKVKRTMKKTNENGDILNLFKQKKFVERDFEDDLQRIIQKYNEMGYRDAKITYDSVTRYDSKHVDVHIGVEEGKKYYINNINWVGNTVYPTEVLNDYLGIFPGDVYNQKRLNKRITEDEDAVSNLYLDNGYLFFNLVPIEERIHGDSIDLMMRVIEGPQARVNRVVINGNDQLYEKVIRRDLRVRPGELFSKSDLMRSYREIASTGHFNPETIDIRPEPNETDGTVDIVFNLESKANDKVQLSFGWGQTGLTGQVALSFSNFSMRNLFNPSSYKGIIPRGDGQTFSISAQTNAQYYQSYSISFFDPWIGGSRPNSFAVSADFSRSTGINSQFYNNTWSTAYQTALYNQYSYNTNYSTYAIQNAYDPNKVLQLAGVSVGYGTRLSWPDDFFQFQAQLAYRWYYLKNWDYLYYMRNGTSNSLTLNLNLSRTSIDNPIYPRRGSSFSIDLTMTPPASLFGRKDWKYLSEQASYFNTDATSREAARSQLYRWIEYWKLRFKSRTYTPLTDPDGKWTLVLMTRADFGLLGSWNKYLKTPFETFYFGGDGMTGSYTYATETISMRGYENGQFTPSGYEGYAYGKFTFELHFPFLLQPATTIYAIAFAEAGNCWTSVSDFSPFNLKRSAGVGARVYLSMLGFLGIDWGYGFDKVWGRRGGSQIHFVLGQEF